MLRSGVALLTASWGTAEVEAARTCGSTACVQPHVRAIGTATALRLHALEGHMLQELDAVTLSALWGCTPCTAAAKGILARRTAVATFRALASRIADAGVASCACGLGVLAAVAFASAQVLASGSLTTRCYHAAIRSRVARDVGCHIYGIGVDCLGGTPISGSA